MLTVQFLLWTTIMWLLPPKTLACFKGEKNDDWPPESSSHTAFGFGGIPLVCFLCYVLLQNLKKQAFVWILKGYISNDISINLGILKCWLFN